MNRFETHKKKTENPSDGERLPRRSPGRLKERSGFLSRIRVTVRPFDLSGLGFEFEGEIQDTQILHPLKILFDPLFSALFVERDLWGSFDYNWVRV